jgi:glutamate-ammonia-ligase adenylyltransferase
MPTFGELARAGILDTAAAAAALDQLQHHGVDAPLKALANAADPDAALVGLATLCAEHAHISERTRDARFAHALIVVLGASPSLVDHLLRHPSDVDMLEVSRDDDWDAASVREHLVRHVVSLDGLVARTAGLRRWYRYHLLGIIVRDVLHEQPIERTWRQLSDLADAALAVALHMAHQEHGHSDVDISEVGLAVVALGKCGAQELNYVSDVDVVFVAPDDVGADDLEQFTAIARTLMDVCAQPSVEGPLWTVDANLRPEGRRGALVRTVSSYLDYYERWAQPWEFQALLKARAVGGDVSTGEQFVEATRRFVWSAGRHPGYIAQARHLRQRAESEIDGDPTREIKLGPGGLRDVEFSVQLLQLVHGADDESLRCAGTLQGLAALAAGGYVGRDDAATLADTYRFLRGLEHRLQLRRLQRTHTLPDQEADLRWLGRGMGFSSNPAQEVLERWRAVALDARRRHEKLFYRPLLDVYAKLDGGGSSLTESAARERYEALGFADPDAAGRHVQALAQGVSRRAVIQRTLLPVILLWLSQSPQPDAGLLAFRRISEALGESHWYLRTLRDESSAAERLIAVLGSSKWLTELLLRTPEAVAMLAEDAQLQPRSLLQLREDMVASSSRYAHATDAAVAIRSVRRRELLRVGIADLLGLIDVHQVGQALSDVMTATIDAMLAAVLSDWENSAGRLAPVRISVIAVGRFGGRELGYGSDADVLFVHEPVQVSEPEATAVALEVIAQVRNLLSAPSPEPLIELDADLRPEGRNGPLVRTLDSYAAYFEQWSSPWEAQAMLRARAVAGDMHLGRAWETMIAQIRWPANGIDDSEIRDIRRIKARVESERLPRGVDPSAHLKLGPGGLSDVEWVVQLLQLQHAGTIEGLRTPSTGQALRGATRAGLLAGSDEQVLAEAWDLSTRLRNHLVLLTGVATDVFPSDPETLRALAHIEHEESAQEIRDDYLRLRRRARAVMERVFYGRVPNA